MPMKTALWYQAFTSLNKSAPPYKQLIIFYTKEKILLILLPMIIMNPFMSPCKLLGLIGPSIQLAVYFPNQSNTSVRKKSTNTCWSTTTAMPNLVTVTNGMVTDISCNGVHGNCIERNGKHEHQKPKTNSQHERQNLPENRLISSVFLTSGIMSHELKYQVTCH